MYDILNDIVKLIPYPLQDLSEIEKAMYKDDVESFAKLIDNNPVTIEKALSFGCIKCIKLFHDKMRKSYYYNSNPHFEFKRYISPSEKNIRTMLILNKLNIYFLSSELYMLNKNYINFIISNNFCFNYKSAIELLKKENPTLSLLITEPKVPEIYDIFTNYLNR